MVAEQRPVLLGILKEELYEGEADENKNRPTWMAEKLSKGPKQDFWNVESGRAAERIVQ